MIGLIGDTATCPAPGVKDPEPPAGDAEFGSFELETDSTRTGVVETGLEPPLVVDGFRCAISLDKPVPSFVGAVEARDDPDWAEAAAVLFMAACKSCDTGLRNGARIFPAYLPMLPPNAAESPEEA
jgi:hypothetical protein